MMELTKKDYRLFWLLALLPLIRAALAYRFIVDYPSTHLLAGQGAVVTKPAFLLLVGVSVVLGGWLPGFVFGVMDKRGLPFARQGAYCISVLWVLGLCLLVVRNML